MKHDLYYYALILTIATFRCMLTTESGSRIIDPFYPNYFTHKAAVRDPCTDGSCFFFN